MYLPADHKCAIRQGFAAFLLLAPLFFLDFWWNFRAQMSREGEGWILYRGLTPVARGGRQAPPVARGGGDRPLPRPWAGPPTGRPRGGDRPPSLHPRAPGQGPI